MPYVPHVSSGKLQATGLIMVDLPIFIMFGRKARAAVHAAYSHRWRSASARSLALYLNSVSAYILVSRQKFTKARPNLRNY